MKRYVCLFLVFILTASMPGCGLGIDPPPDIDYENSQKEAAPDKETDAGMEADTDTEAGTETQTSGESAPPPDNADSPQQDETILPEDGITPPEEDEESVIVEGVTPPPPTFGFVDAHADTISRALLPQHDAGLFRNNLHVDFERLLEFGTPVQVFALWLSDRFLDDAFERTNYMIDFFEREIERHSDIIAIALTLEDLVYNAENGKISAILSIEGGEALVGRLENVDHFFNRGVRIMSLTWNRENELGFGQATGSSEGLKPFGKEVVKRMEELGMIIDISHINEAGFWDIHNLSARPYMASHSNAFAVTPHRRNLTDRQITAMVERGGIIGLVLFPQFLIRNNNNNVSMDDIFAHINHFIELGAGGHLGLGGDLDGFRDMPAGLECVLSYKILAERIAERFDDETSLRIMSVNFYEFFVRYFDG